MLNLDNTTSNNQLQFKGIGLLSTLLSLTVLSLVILFVTAEVSDYNFRQRQKSVTADLARLTNAATDLVSQNYQAFETSVNTAGGILAYSPENLIAAGTLPASFALINDVGQTYVIYYRLVSTGKLDVLVTTLTPANNPIDYNLIALNNYTGNGHIGIISPRSPDELQGPSLLADITPYRVLAGEPSLGETAVISHLTTTDIFKGYLYRIDQPGHALATTMETNLDLGSFDLRGAGEIESETMTIEQQLTVLGGAEIVEDLAVGNSLRVDGTSTLETLTSTNSTFTGSVQTSTLQTTDTTTAGEVEVTGTLQADNIDISTEITSPLVNADTINTHLLEGRDIQIENAILDDLEASRLIVDGNVLADTAAINNLNVGGCTGC